MVDTYTIKNAQQKFSALVKVAEDHEVMKKRPTHIHNPSGLGWSFQTICGHFRSALNFGSA